MNLNKCFIGGRLVRDPDLKFTPSNTAVCTFGVAINRQWKDNNGEKKEEVTFLDLEAWGRTAEVINEHLRKGDPIFCEARAGVDRWQDKEGNNRSKVKFTVESFQFVGGRKDGGEQEQRPAPKSGQAAPARRAPSGPPLTHQPVGEDSIPFAHDAFQL